MKYSGRQPKTATGRAWPVLGVSRKELFRLRPGDKQQGGGLRPEGGAEVQSLRICPLLRASSPVGSEDYVAPPPAAPLRPSHPEARRLGLLPGKLSGLREEPCLQGRDPSTQLPSCTAPGCRGWWGAQGVQDEPTVSLSTVCGSSHLPPCLLGWS